VRVIAAPANRVARPTRPVRMASGDRLVLATLGFLSFGTFAAIFAATQDRKVERYRREGRALPPGFR